MQSVGDDMTETTKFSLLKVRFCDLIVPDIFVVELLYLLGVLLFLLHAKAALYLCIAAAEVLLVIFVFFTVVMIWFKNKLQLTVVLNSILIALDFITNAAVIH